MKASADGVFWEIISGATISGYTIVGDAIFGRIIFEHTVSREAANVRYR